MNVSTHMVTTLDVAGGIPVALRPGRDARLRVLRGSVWLTVEGDADDVVLRAGDEAVLSAARAMVEGLGPVTLQIVEPRATRHGRGAVWTRRVLQRARQALTRLQFGPGLAQAGA